MGNVDQLPDGGMVDVKVATRRTGRNLVWQKAVQTANLNATSGLNAIPAFVSCNISLRGHSVILGPS